MASRIWLVVKILLLLLLLAIAGIWVALSLSVPLNESKVAHPDLQSQVLVDMDEYGVPHIKAENRADGAWVTGYLHGQSRYFQMDLLRRRGAGELSVLFGARALDMDKTSRLHQFRKRAAHQLSLLPAAQQQLLDIYVKGVNAGLAALRVRPPEYLMLMQQPEPWTAVDSLLVVYAMYFGLQDGNGDKKLLRTLIHDRFPQDYALLLPNHTEFDSPVIGENQAVPHDLSSLYRQLKKGETSQGNAELGETEPAHGSSSWVVSGAHTADGRAILSNDIHLGLYLPNQWYRLGLSIGEHRITGVTLPGMPLVVAGSNGFVSWGLTNSYGNWSDLTVVDDKVVVDREEIEDIKVGEAVEQLTIKHTRFGPILPDGGYAVKWLAHTDRAVNLNLLAFEQARSVEQIIALAPSIGVPPQNLLVADSQGHIGWTIIGPLPQRDKARFATTAAEHGPWTWVEAENYPQLIDPKSGFIWSANNRMYEKSDWPSIGEDDFLNGARAWQIHESLVRLHKADVKSVAAIQFDNRALMLARWHRRLTQALEAQAQPDDDLQRLMGDWDGHASKDSVAYTLTRAARNQSIADFYQPFLAQLQQPELIKSFRRINSNVEQTVWTAIDTEQAGLFGAEKLDDYLYGVLLSSYQTLLKEHDDEEKLRWGWQNRLRMNHPLGLPLWPLDSVFNMAPQEQAGDQFMPAINEPRFGASIRYSVSPGQEHLALVAMPGGQSGHPLSEHYSMGHQRWLEQKWLPFLGGETQQTFEFSPSR